MQTKHRHKKNLKTKAKTKKKTKYTVGNVLKGTISSSGSWSATSDPQVWGDAPPADSTVTTPLGIGSFGQLIQGGAFLSWWVNPPISVSGNIAAILNRMVPGLPLREQLQYYFNNVTGAMSNASATGSLVVATTYSAGAPDGNGNVHGTSSTDANFSYVATFS